MVNIFSLPSQLYPFAFVLSSILILNEEPRQMHVDVVSWFASWVDLFLTKFNSQFALSPTLNIHELGLGD